MLKSVNTDKGAAAETDGKRAYDSIGKMEDPIYAIGGFCKAIRYVALAEGNDILAHTLIALVDAMEEKLEKVDAARGEAFEATHGFAHGS